MALGQVLQLGSSSIRSRSAGGALAVHSRAAASRRFSTAPCPNLSACARRPVSAIPAHPVLTASSTPTFYLLPRSPPASGLLFARYLSTSPVHLKKKDKGGAKGGGKKKGKSQPVEEEENFDEEDDEDFGGGKGKSKAGGKSSGAGGGELYNPENLQAKLDHVVSRAQMGVRDLLSRVGRPDPKILEKLVVQLHHKDAQSSHLIRDLATVGVQNNQFLVHCFDPTDTKAVEKAVYDSDLELVPLIQPGDEEGTIRLPVPKPTLEMRDSLAKQLSQSVEHAKRDARDVRRWAMKIIKANISAGQVGESLGKKQEKDVDKEIKKSTDAIDKHFAEAQKKLKAVVVDDS